MTTWRQQEGFTVRFEWGAVGAAELARLGDVVIVVDVLSFSTAVSVAVERGMRIVPLDEATQSAPSGLPVAVSREAMDAAHPWSLSPASMRTAPFTEVVVLPSPNGASVSARAAAAGATVLAGCLRNARVTAVAALRALRGTDPAGQRRRPVNTVLVIAAGERWADGSLRPAVEDLLGAGAVIAELVAQAGDGVTCSPEAMIAMRAWTSCSDPQETLLHCASGRELLLRGYPDDVNIALEHNLSDVVAMLSGDSFSAVEL